MTASILPLPSPHPQDCPVCGGLSLVQVHLLRRRDGEEYVSRVGRLRPCLLRSGADDLRALLARVELTPVGGDVA